MGLSSKKTTYSAATKLSIGIFLSASMMSATAETITIESWLVNGKALWEDKILPVFESANPGISVTFAPAIGSGVDYDESVQTHFARGTAADLITCRPFDASLALYQAGYLEDLSTLEGLSEFSPAALAAWSTDDGKSTYCVPLASVIHGFIYNESAFAELALEVPQTQSEFFATLEKIKTESSYLPLSHGTLDLWESGTMGYNNIGAAHWQGEAGRKALISGDAKMTDEPYVEAFRQLARWKPYLADDFANQSYSDSELLLAYGRAAIYPAGSWEIGTLQENTEFELFELGVFPPPRVDKDSDCYISDQADIGIGMNAKTENREAVLRFLQWTTTEEFANVFSNAAPGFFTLSNHQIEIENELANEFAAMRATCQSTIRLTSQILSRGDKPLGYLLWSLSADVIKGKRTPEEAAAAAQANLEQSGIAIKQSLNEE